MLYQCCSPGFANCKMLTVGESGYGANRNYLSYFYFSSVSLNHFKLFIHIYICKFLLYTYTLVLYTHMDSTIVLSFLELQPMLMLALFLQISKRSFPSFSCTLSWTPHLYFKNSNSNKTLRLSKSISSINVLHVFLATPEDWEGRYSLAFLWLLDVQSVFRAH